MEVSALKHSGRAFELLVSRYETRLLSFCRHLLRSREDAEDVLQEVMTAAYNAMLSDDRPINVRPWLYRIARNRCLNHLRKAQAIGVDSMDVHFSDNGASTADKVHDREEFQQLVGDIHGLPETQRTALVLREMDALSYEQIAEAMDTTVPSVKSLLVRARVSLAEASEARLLTCEEVREELGEVAEGLIKKPSPAVRRHVKSCNRCERFEKEIRHSSKALAAALVPIGAIGMLRKVLLVHLLGHSAGSGAAGGTGAVAGAGATAGAAGVAGGANSAGLISAGVGAVATKAAAGFAAAALVTAGTVAVSREAHHNSHQRSGLQVLTTSVNAGVARSDAIAPRLAAPVQAAPAAKPVKTRAHTTRAVKPANTVHKRLAAAPAAKATSVTPTPATPVTAVAATTPTATAASVGTPTLGTTTTPTLTTTTATAPTTTTPTPTTTTTPTGTTTTPTTTTPATTTTTPSSPPVTGGAGIVTSPSVTSAVTTAAPTPSS
jgi:RNA polymerase sigma factor (sigma-70 family)